MTTCLEKITTRDIATAERIAAGGRMLTTTEQAKEIYVAMMDATDQPRAALTPKDNTK